MNHGREKKGIKTDKKKAVAKIRLEELSKEMKFAKNNTEIPEYRKSSEISVIYPVEDKKGKT